MPAVRPVVAWCQDDHGANEALAARHLGMSWATIYRTIRGYTIDPRP